MSRDHPQQQALGVLHNQIKQAKILLVGAGGIGCELLKNLVLTGFGEIHVVDLDTIDLSNLNRQFLFRQEHIKKPKALVAKESANQFNPHVKVEAYHANIKDSNFNVEWFQSFSLVFNALDNLEARRHVNRMCLAADVPLIESGTTGFEGQVQVIKQGKTECYDCNVKPVPKSFPVCTIRSTPSQPIHCIVWAKSYLFTELFGTSEEIQPDLDNAEDPENAQEIESLRAESIALQQLRHAIGSDDFPEKVFAKVFQHDILRLRNMEDMWKGRRPPVPLNFNDIMTNTKSLDREIARKDQQTWTLPESCVVFSDSLQRLSTRVKKAPKSQDEIITLNFDKDDEDSLDFVAATANIRSHIFGIEPKSKFDIKQMAGNIIPAIATTNAMTAGLCVLQAFKVLRGQYAKAQMVFLERSGARVINTDTLKPPNADCAICGVFQSRLVIDANRATLSDFVKDVLQSQLGYGDELSVSNDVGILYDPDLEDNLPKRFEDLGIKADSFLTVIDDDEEDPRINLSLSVSMQDLPTGTKPVSIPEGLNIPRKSRVSSLSPSDNGGDAARPKQVNNGNLSKRKRSLDNGVDLDQTSKKSKEHGLGLSKDRAVDVNGLDNSDGIILIAD